MNSKQVKSEMLAHALYRLHYMAAVTEYGGKGVLGVADIIAVHQSGYSHEFEVKVTKADLAGELETIKYLLDPQTELGQEPKKYLAKSDKHRIYINGPSNETYAQLELRPNKFSFVVPVELSEYAKAALKNTPYGLYVIKSGPECSLKADYLHKEKVTSELLEDILHKACMEVETLRRQVARGSVCPGCYSALPGRCESCDNKIKNERKYRKASNLCFAKVENVPYGQERSEAFKVCMTEQGIS
jgi:hypothetical protein